MLLWGRQNAIKFSIMIFQSHIVNFEYYNQDDADKLGTPFPFHCQIPV